MGCRDRKLFKNGVLLMFGSHVEMKMKANSVSQAKDLASVLEPEIRSLGLNQSLLRDK